MTDREKLIELMTEAIPIAETPLGVECAPKMKMGTLFAGKLADHLIANGVTFAKDTNVPINAHWIIRSSGKGDQTTNWAECSECHVCGSPQWKVCPVCEARMVE